MAISPETAVNVNVLVDVVGTTGDLGTHEFFDVSIAGDGLRVPICYLATHEGAGRIIVTAKSPRACACSNSRSQDALRNA